MEFVDCKVCGEAFESEYSRKNHHRIIHQIELQVKTINSTYKNRVNINVNIDLLI